MPELSPRRRMLVLAICCMSLFIVGLDVTIVNIALPSIRNDLHASVSGLQWTLDAYTVVLASLLMLSGSTADRVGRRRTFQTGLVIFTLGSLLCSLAPGLGWLVAFRAVQAVGGSMLNPVAMSIITNTFTEPRERARAIGVWGGVVGLSMALGPVIGGALVASVGWRSIFWINIPVGIAAVVLSARFVPESKAPRARRLDPVGQVLVIAVLASLTYAIIEGPKAGFAVRAGDRALRLLRRRPDRLARLRASPLRAARRGPALPQRPVQRRNGHRRLRVRLARRLPLPEHPLSAGRSGPVRVARRPLHASDGRDDADIRADLRPPRRQPRTPPVARCRRHRDDDRDADADPARGRHLAGVALLGLRDLRFRLRGGQRAHHQHRGLGPAARAGRGRRGVRLDQPPDRLDARSGRDRVGRDRTRRRQLPHRLCRAPATSAGGSSPGARWPCWSSACSPPDDGRGRTADAAAESLREPAAQSALAGVA